MNLLVFSGMNDNKLKSKLEPLAASDRVDRIFLLRKKPLDCPKVTSLKLPVFLRVSGIQEYVKFVWAFVFVFFHPVDCVMGIFLRPHGIFAHFVGKILNKPVIQIFPGNDVDFILRFSRIFVPLLRKARFIGVRGPKARDRLNMLVRDKKKFFIQHNEYTLTSLPVIKTEGRKKYDIICIADFSRVKRIDVFLKVVGRLQRKYPRIRAVMLGGGWQRGWYVFLRFIHELGSSVVFAGRVKDVFCYLKKSRVFLLTSQAEGMPMSVIEAMSAGIPCVLSDVGEIGDIINDGVNGFLVQPLDVGDFVEKIGRLLESEELSRKMAKNAFHTLEEKSGDYSRESNMKVWENVLS
ncbi:MAG: glycosyltransferase family 4 protein [Candidatus Aminicenantes bacterium]|nr:glycosyltransferase family 4 protein [Candidatus Aminicenantes bacterium]